MQKQKKIPGIREVNDYLRRFGESVGVTFKSLDETGFTKIRYGSAEVGINVLEDRNVILFLAPIMKVPSQGQLQLYRKLLELNLLATANASFAIDSRTDLIYVRAFRGLEAFDYEEFVDMLATVSMVADEWGDKLRKEFPSET